MRFYPTKEEKEKVKMFIEAQKVLIPIALHEIEGTKSVIDVGSTSKGTFVSGSYDIDLYVFCSEADKAYNIISEKIPHGNKKEGELLIWNAQMGEFDVDYIFRNPNAKKREDTLKHSKFFNKHLTKAQKREVIKAKAFLKTKGLYGAEIGGIIGVAIEELIRQKKTFKGICEYLTKICVTIDRPHIQDPTMKKSRNLLACIIPQRFEHLLMACVEYLKNPHFTYKPMDLETFRDQYPCYSTMMFKRKSQTNKGKDFQAILCATRHTANILKNRENKEVKVNYDLFVDDKTILLCYKVRPLELSKFKEVCLPHDIKESYIKAFKKAKDWYEKNSRVCAMVERKIQFPDTFFITEIQTRAKKRGYDLV